MTTTTTKPCPRASCIGTYIEICRDDVVYFCGVPKELCEDCIKEGYTILSGAGDSDTIWDKSGKKVETKQSIKIRNYD